MMRKILIVGVMAVTLFVPAFGQGVELTPRERYERLPTLGRPGGDSTPGPVPPLLSEPPLADARPSDLIRPPSYGSIPPADLPETAGPPATSPPRGYLEGFGTYGHYELKKAVDLREFLPTPGQQQGNSCFSWAAGYASYTCQIAQERHRDHPREAWQTFSPDYIFDRIPDSGNGVDAGEVFDCLREQGCASLAACAPGNSHPEYEAQLYKALEHERAQSLDDIKIYLSQGYPVVLVVQLDAAFEDFQSGSAPYVWNGAEPSPRYHAVCAVGFDSAAGKVLIMNSAGTDWKDGGFCWVKQSSLTHVDQQSWCVEAHVFKVKKSLPLRVSDRTVRLTRQRRFRPSVVLKPDHAIYGKSDAVISPPSWRFDDVSWTDKKVYGLRDNFTVYRRQSEKSWVTMKEGLNRSPVTMIAGTGRQPLHALTDSGKLFRADESFVWQPVALPTSAKIVDLRNVGTKMYAVAVTGRVLTFTDGSWKYRAEP